MSDKPGNAEPWWWRANCRGTDPKLFFPEERKHEKEVTPEAALLCAMCEVGPECEADALAHDDIGTRNGKTYKDRIREQKIIALSAARSQGIGSAVAGHYREGA